MGKEKLHKSALKPLESLSRVTFCARPGLAWEAADKRLTR